jgi:hypothetical protein
MLLISNFFFYYGFVKFERRYNEEVLFAISFVELNCNLLSKKIIDPSKIVKDH